MSPLERSRRPALALLAALALSGAAACTRGTVYARGGALQPTVAGRAPASFTSLEQAKAAFSRSQGPMTATLVDAAWIRLEADPGDASKRYPAYFEGLTTFQVQLAADQILRPTQETFVLEDSTGARVTAKPPSFKTDLGEGFGPRVITTFTLTFEHAITSEVRWIRLTREGDGGGSVSWEFPE